MKISVAMALYRPGDFLEPQLRSILTQTRPPDEIVLGDDAPDAVNAALIDKLQREFPGTELCYTANPRTLGVSLNFASVIERTTGELIFLSDQDDVWLPEKIELLAGAAGDGGAFCNSTAVDAGLRPLGYTHWNTRQYAPIPDPEHQFIFFLRRVPAAGHNMVFHARWKELLLPFPGLRACHDSWIGLMIATIAEWHAVDRELTLYRVHDNNLSHPRRPGVSAQLAALAESRYNNSIEWTIELLYAALLRCDEQRITIDPHRRALLLERLRHARIRESLPDAVLPKILTISRELFSGRYSRWGHGWRNAVQDLLFR